MDTASQNIQTAVTTLKETAEEIGQIELAHQRIDQAELAIGRIEKLMQWLGTTVIGAIILAVLNLVLKG